MSIYSTASLSREKALKIVQMNLHNLTNDQLEEILFTIYSEKTLNNFNVSDWEPEKDEITERFLNDLWRI